MYVGINMQEIAEAQHGAGAQAIAVGPHAYDWGAHLPNGQRKGLELQAFADQRYGGNWRAVLTNLSKNGWAWYNPFQSNWLVQPVLMVAQDLKYDIAAVDKAIVRVQKNIQYAQSWYKEHVGKTFVVSPQTQIVICKESAQQLLALGRTTNNAETRYALLDYHQNAYYSALGNRVNSCIHYVCVSFTGYHPAEDYGSANRGNLTCLSSDNSSIDLNPSAWTQPARRAAYDATHEIGHGLGLSHPTEQDGVDWWKSIMYQGEPDWAILLPREKKFLSTHPMMTV